MEQLREVRCMNEALGELTDRLNPEFFEGYPVAGQDAVVAYGRRHVTPFTLTDVNGRALITDGRPNSGFELLYAAHAEMAASVAISSHALTPGATDGRAESFWVSRHGVTRSRFAELPESPDGILWLTPFETLESDLLEVAGLSSSTYVPAGMRAPVKRDAVKHLFPRDRAVAAMADAVRKDWPEVAAELSAGRGRELTVYITLVSDQGVQEHVRTWVVTPSGALVIEFEKERMFRADTFITGMSHFQLRQEIESLLPGEDERRSWVQLAEATAADRIDTSIPE